MHRLKVKLKNIFRCSKSFLGVKSEKRLKLNLRKAFLFMSNNFP